MIRPVRWPSTTRFLVFAHHGARHAGIAAGRVWATALAISIAQQAHRQLCNQLRDLAARIVTESP